LRLTGNRRPVKRMIL